MANAYIPTNLSGGFSYTPMSFNITANGQTINGGYAFDLPLATVAGFTNAALDFNANNTNAARGFLANVTATAQGNVDATANRAFTQQTNALDAIKSMFNTNAENQRYAIKKAYTRGCFITTAVTQAKGLPDDCSELQTLRKFRDEILSATEEGQKLVDLYYRVAPAIVEVIDAMPIAKSIYARFDSLFIQPALHRIGTGEHDIAQGIYTALVHEAAKLAGVSLELIETVDSTFFGD